MVEITAAAVRALRDRTDLPMMDCKQALVEANGDEEQALQILKNKGKKAIDKRKDNVTSEGRFFTYVADNAGAAGMVEMLCESAPVAKSDDFAFLGDQLAKQLVLGPGAKTAEELLTQPAPDRAGATLADLHEDTTNKIREKIVINRVVRVPGPVGAYVHHDGKTGVLFQASGTPKSTEVLRDVAMHIAALKPKATLPSELDPQAVAAERARLSEEAKASGKPANIIDKIVDGRMKTYYNEQGVLVEQPFAKDDTKTVGKVLSEVGLTAVGFTRWLLGQS
jgi:elongation factor Ts